MSQRIVILLLAGLILVAAGVFWYSRQRGYQGGESGRPQAPSPEITEQTGEDEQVFDVISYTTTSAATEISLTSLADRKRRIVFTDQGERLTVRALRRATDDGRTVLAIFSKKGEETARILGLISLDGSGKITELLDNFGSTEAPILSPDGKKVAYIVFSNADPDYGYSLFIMNTDGSNKRRLVRKETLLTSPAFRPDGQRLAYLSDTGDGMAIEVIDTDGGTAATTISQFSNAILYDLSWGSRLIFGKRPREDSQANEGEIYTLSENGSGLARLTQNQAYEGSPLLSADGALFSVLRTVFPDGKYSAAGELTLVVINLTDQTETELGSADGILGWKPAKSRGNP